MADDFSEEDADLDIEDDGFADEDIGGEEWDDFEDSGADNEARAPAKKKPSLFNKLVIGGGVLVAAVVLFLQFGGGSSQPQQQKSAALPPRGAVDVGSVTSQAPAPAPDYALPKQASVIPPSQDSEAKRAELEQAAKPPSTGFLGDPSSLSSVQTMRGKMEFEEYDGAQPTETRLTPQVVDQGAMPPMPAPLEQAESDPFAMESDQSADPAVLTPMPQQAQMQANDFTRPNGNSGSGMNKEQDMSSVMARMDELLARMDQMEETLAGIQDGKIAALEKMSARIDKMEKRAPSPAPASQKAAVSGSRESAPASVPASSSWVLKSAQPDKAIVAKKGESEVYAVAVGDTLAGIGRIESIGMDGGLWVVRGTKGKIVQ